MLREVEVRALALERLHVTIGPERTRAFEATAAAASCARGQDRMEHQLHGNRRGRRRDAADTACLCPRRRCHDVGS